jgi:hypothetical protein
MVKYTDMKKAILFLLPLCLLKGPFLFSQNVGIGIANPSRAKLEVNGTVGYTTAIFGGETTGIGILQNNPGIGFNDYFSAATHKYIANGYSGTIWFDAVNGGMFFDVFGYGNANTAPTTGVNSMVISNAGNVGIRTYQTLDASLFVVKAGNTQGSAVFSGTNYASFFHNGVNEDTYIRGGKAGSRVILNDITNGLTMLGANSSNITEVYGKLYGYGGSPNASTAMNMVPLGVVQYSGNLNNITSGNFATNYQNLVGSFVTGSSGYYSNNSTVADYINISLPLDLGVFSQYSMVIGINNLNFNGDAGVSGGNALITRIYSNVINGASPYYLIEVGVDDFGNIGPAEVAAISGTVIFYGLR